MDRMGEDESLTPEEEAAMAALSRGQHPDPRLEDRVVEALRARGTIRPGSGRLAFRSVLAAAAAIGIFLFGLTLGRSSARPAPEPATQSGRQWLLLLYSDGAFEEPGEEAARRADVASWPRELAARGALVDGRELVDETLLLGGCGDVLVTSASARAGQRILRGYYILRAPTLEKAIEMAKTSPHLSYGGIITLSEIVPGRRSQPPATAHIRLSMLTPGSAALVSP